MTPRTAIAVAVVGLGLLLAALGGAALAAVSGDLSTQGPTFGAMTLHPTACKSGMPATVRGGVELIDRAHSATVRVLPTERHQGPRLQVVVGSAGSRAARSVTFEPGDCTRIDTHIDERSQGDAAPGAHGHVEIQCRTAAGDGVSGSVDFADCAH